MIWLWTAFLALILLLLALDLGVFHRKSHIISVREALGWTALWVALGLAFSGVVYLIYEHDWGGALTSRRDPAIENGLDATVLYVMGYFLEKSLSVDNILVISLLFSAMRVPPQFQHRVLFWGILGAIVFRGVMIAGGIWFVTRFSWAFYVFGAFLVISGIRMMFAGEDEGPEPEASWFYRFIRRVLPVAPGQHGSRFTIRIDGRLFVTTTFVALLAIELTDVLFAVDSVPAILGVTQEPFIVVTSNVFAILGLRSLYFVLAGMMDMFHHLKVALAVLLVVIGAKMVFHHHYKVDHLISLAVVVGIVAIGVVASLLTARKPPPGAGPTAGPSDGGDPAGTVI
jgi:tellurite resistance protein TerC